MNAVQRSFLKWIVVTNYWRTSVAKIYRNRFRIGIVQPVRRRNETLDESIVAVEVTGRHKPPILALTFWCIDIPSNNHKLSSKVPS